MGKVDYIVIKTISNQFLSFDVFYYKSDKIFCSKVDRQDEAFIPNGYRYINKAKELCIQGSSIKILKDNLQKMLDDRKRANRKLSKIIIYKIDATHGGRFSQDFDNEINITFGYEIVQALRSGSDIYYKPLDSTSDKFSERLYPNETFLDYSPEAEAYCKQLHLGFEELQKKMVNFFGAEGKQLQTAIDKNLKLIGTNQKQNKEVNHG